MAGDTGFKIPGPVNNRLLSAPNLKISTSNLATNPSFILPAANGGTNSTNSGSFQWLVSTNWALSASSGSSVSITVPNSGTLSTLAGSETLTNKTLTSPIMTAPALGTVASGVISACTSTSMVMVTPVLGTPTSGTLTNCTGYTEANLSVSDITTNNASTSAHGLLKKLDNTATHYMDGTGVWSTPPTTINLTGPITSVGAATSIASQTGTGTKFVVDTSPTLVTPTEKNPTIADTTDTTKNIQFTLSGATTAKTMTISSSHTNTRTLTLPDATDTLVGKATTDTLTNKTLTSPTMTSPALGTVSSGVISACTSTSMTMVTPVLGAATATSINFGDTSLSKYKESTWTPVVTLVGGAGNTVPTYTGATSGVYTRTGNIVYCVITFYNASGGTAGAGTGQFTVTLPIAAAGSLIGLIPFPVGTALNGSTYYDLYGTIGSGSSTIAIFYNSLVTLNSAFTGAQQNDASTRIVQTRFFYEV